MLKIICWMGHLCVRDHLDSNPIWKIPRRIVSFQERKLTYFNNFTFLSFFFLFDPTLVVFTRLFRCAFFLLTPVMSDTKHEEVKITRRSLRDWKSTEQKSVQIPSFSPDRRKWGSTSCQAIKQLSIYLISLIFFGSFAYQRYFSSLIQFRCIPYL